MNASGDSPLRHRGDLCPGVLRPWPADDGALVRLRLIGGALPPAALAGLVEVARHYGDGNVHLTRRANLQLRALPIASGPTESGSDGGCLAPEVVEAITATGLLPSPSHELVRNIMVSPLSGAVGGRTDLRPLAHELDRALCADPVYAGLSARFLFVLDDGRGDVLDRSCDLGLVALDDSHAQLRVGEDWGPVVRLVDAPAALLELAGEFVAARGTGPTAAWHMTELDRPLRASHPRDPRTQTATDPPPLGPVPDAATRIEHVGVPDGVLTPELAHDLLDAHDPTAVDPTDGPDRLVVTPWRSVLVDHGIV